MRERDKTRRAGINLEEGGEEEKEKEEEET
jgi:hypothetical protein